MPGKYTAGYTDVPEILEIIGKFSSRMQEVLIDEMLGHIVSMILETQGCESPIEELLMVGLSTQDRSCSMRADDGCYAINPQREISVKDKVYRVDFLVTAIYQGRTRNVVVECDGHDFHEKTKQQSRQDKQRDRDLVKAGYEVIRFTGSEIYENPYYCARQVNDIVFKSG